MPTARHLLPSVLVTLLFSLAPLAHARTSTWTNLDGQTMEAEFLGRKGDHVSFQKTDGSRYLYPYAKLSEADRTRADVLASKLPPEPVAEVKATPATRPGTLATALTGKLVVPRGSGLSPAPREKLDGVKHIAFYYSAHWCPPCRAFTPELVEAYKQIKAKHPDFELVFVTSDRDAKAMTKYVTEYNMPWPSVRFGDHRSLDVLKRPAHERGIPNLVFMDADGKELAVSYTPDGKYRGPRNVLRDIKKHFEL